MSTSWVPASSCYQEHKSQDFFFICPAVAPSHTHPVASFQPSAKSGQRSQHLDSVLTSYIIQTPLSCPLCNEGSEDIWSSGTSLRVPVLYAGVSQVPRFLPTRAGKYCSCVLCTDILALSLWPWVSYLHTLNLFPRLKMEVLI